MQQVNAVPLFHCQFGNGELTHFMHEGVDDVAASLPYLYAVCLSHNDSGLKKIVAGLIVRTNRHHSEPTFLNMLYECCVSIPRLNKLLNANTSFLPVKIGVTGSPLLTEDECLHIIQQEYVKRSVSGQVH